MLVYVLRQLEASDWQLLKDMRLEALVKEPRVFSGALEEESQRSDSVWQERVTAKDKAYFCLFSPDGECVGLTGVLKHKDQDDAVVFLATYIRKEHRGLGLSALFYKSRINWAKRNNFKKAVISFRDDNFASKAAGERAGFIYKSSESKIYPDNTVGNSLLYELNLENVDFVSA
jgi:RimJ/RimL family protein N-acetyltransferase